MGETSFAGYYGVHLLSFEWERQVSLVTMECFYCLLSWRGRVSLVIVECIYCLLSGRGRVSLVIVECIYCRHVDGYCGILALTLSGTSRISLVNMECIYWKGKRDEGYTGNCGIRLLPLCGRLRDTIRIK